MSLAECERIIRLFGYTAAHLDQQLVPQLPTILRPTLLLHHSLQKSWNFEAIRSTISTAFLAHVLIFQKGCLRDTGATLEPFHRAHSGDHEESWQELLRCQNTQDQTSYFLVKRPLEPIPFSDGPLLLDPRDWVTTNAIPCRPTRDSKAHA